MCVCVCVCVCMWAYIRKFKNIKRRALCCLEPYPALPPSHQLLTNNCPQCGTKACAPEYKKPFSNIRSHKTTASFTSSFLTNRLLAWCFLPVSKEKAIGRTSYCQLDMRRFYIFFRYIITWLARYLRKTPT